jgi:hypothetical protein
MRELALRDARACAAAAAGLGEAPKMKLRRRRPALGWVARWCDLVDFDVSRPQLVRNGDLMSSVDPDES